MEEFKISKFKSAAEILKVFSNKHMQNIENYFNNVDQIIGKKIGVSAQQLPKYENAKNRISAARLSLIAKVLDKDISYFYQT